MRDYSESVGVSSLFMQVNSKEDTLWTGLDRAFDVGLKAVEIVPSNIQGHSGWPKTRFCVGFDIDELSAAEREKLAESVSRFPIRNVHGMHRDLNIASRNKGIAGESVRQYLMCAQLAVDIGAQTLTYHSGSPAFSEGVGDEDFVIGKNIEFGKRIAEFAEKHNLIAGYENSGIFPTLEQMVEIIEGVGSRRFGMHFDLGHVWLSETKDPAAWIRDANPIAVFHLHGTFHRPDRVFENHMPLEQDDCTDFHKVFEALEGAGFNGPIICEIIHKNIRDYLEACVNAKNIIRCV